MKMHALFVALAVILPIAASPAQNTVKPAAKDQAETPAQKIARLQKERVATLKDLVEGLTRLVQASRAEFAELIDARLLLLQAELSAAEKEEERIAIYTKTIASLEQLEELAMAKKQAGRATEMARLQVKARRLEVQIQLEQAKAREAKKGK